jgi:hypothetical protein
MVDGKFGLYIKKIGDKYYPQGRPIVHTDKLWQEKTWEVRQSNDGRCFFEFLAARHGGGTDTYQITADEFECVKDGRLGFDDLIRLTDHDPSRSPLKGR